MEQNWIIPLRSFLSGSQKTAVLGVGSPLRGDDGAGVLCAHALEQKIETGKAPANLVVFVGETAPENLTGVIIREKPDRLLIIDAVVSNQCIDDIVFFPHLEDTDEFSASTHKMPLKVLCTYFRNSMDCKVAVIGIAAGSCAFGTGVSKSVETASLFVANEILACLAQTNL
jgi:hydrogenase maturation protease